MMVGKAMRWRHEVEIYVCNVILGAIICGPWHLLPLIIG